MSITVKVKNIYGQDLIYPADDNARRFAQLANKKTLSASDIRLIKELGYSINVKQLEL